MVKRTAIIHIGTPKTGTTSIQRTLSDNREKLRELGFAYPKSPGSVSHIRLAGYMTASAGAQIGRLQLLSGPMEIFTKALRDEVNALPESVHTVVFSSEHAFNRGFEPGVVQALREFFDEMFDRYKIVVYLRRQDEQAISLLSTRVKAGRTMSSAFPDSDTGRMIYDFDRGIAPWVAAFGMENTVAKIFARNEMKNGDVVQDFLDVCNLPALPQPPAEANTSLLPQAQEFLRRLNLTPEPTRKKDAAADDAPAPPKVVSKGSRPPSYLRSFLSAQYTGKGILPSRAEAQAFFATFAESNERLRSTFFPTRPQLFHSDFSRYPEKSNEPTSEDVLSVALAVSRLQAQIIGEMRADKAIEKALAEKSAGNRRAMVSGFLKALEYHPTNKVALREFVAAVETTDEVYSLRQFLAGARISKQRKEAIQQELSERFGGEALASRRVAARKAERKAARQAERRAQPAVARRA